MGERLHCLLVPAATRSHSQDRPGSLLKIDDGRLVPEGFERSQDLAESHGKATGRDLPGKGDHVVSGGTGLLDMAGLRVAQGKDGQGERPWPGVAADGQRFLSRADGQVSEAEICVAAGFLVLEVPPSVSLDPFGLGSCGLPLVDGVAEAQDDARRALVAALEEMAPGAHGQLRTASLDVAASRKTYDYGKTLLIGVRTRYGVRLKDKST
jgi:hypothetical protein